MTAKKHTTGCRVTSKVARSAKTGRFVTSKSSKSNTGTTIRRNNISAIADDAEKRLKGSMKLLA